jgi:peptidoglycan/LPS O-acetylase OafA/YrhL
VGDDAGVTAAAVRAGTTNKLGHRPGLDAVRGAAALAVVVAHSGVGPTRAAAVAVTVFFVLSGFLITSGLLEQRDGSGVGFARFYERRARRLLPALVPVLIVGTALNVVWWPEVNHAATFVAGLGFQLNWWDAAGQPVGVFGGLWSLAVEEHFYLAWPLLVALVPARRLPVVLAAMVGASLAAGWVAPISDTVMYRATPFRTGELAMGALCAAAFRRGLQRPPWSAAALGVMGLAWVAQRPTWADYVPIGPTVGGACAAVLVLWMVGARGWRPLNWSGRLSYGIYLWHAPVYMVALELGLARWWLLAVSLPATIGIAWCSHRWVEARWLTPQHRRGQPGEAGAVVGVVGLVGRIPEQHLVVIDDDHAVGVDEQARPVDAPLVPRPAGSSLHDRAASPREGIAVG